MPFYFSIHIDTLPTQILPNLQVNIMVKRTNYTIFLELCPLITETSATKGLSELACVSSQFSLNLYLSSRSSMSFMISWQVSSSFSHGCQVSTTSSFILGLGSSNLELSLTEFSSLILANSSIVWAIICSVVLGCPCKLSKEGSLLFSCACLAKWEGSTKPSDIFFLETIGLALLDNLSKGRSEFLRSLNAALSTLALPRGVLLVLPSFESKTEVKFVLAMPLLLALCVSAADLSWSNSGVSVPLIPKVWLDRSLLWCLPSFFVFRLWMIFRITFFLCLEPSLNSQWAWK